MTLSLWLIQKINTKDWRIGKVTGWKHPEITQEVLNEIGKQQLLSEARELERLGIIKPKWEEFGNDISRIHIAVSQMDRLCGFAGVENPKKKLEETQKIIRHWQEDAADDWRQDYYCYLYEQTEKGNFPSVADDEAIFRCLNRLPGQEKDCWKRVFSAHVLGNSKLFEKKYENRIITILRDYSPYVDEAMDDEEVLAEHGILTYSQTLEWKGPLTYCVDGAHCIDTSVSVYGTIVNAQTLEHAEPVCAKGIKKIITIENKANYEDQKYSADTLYIFTHGFMSPKERRFLKKLEKITKENTQFCHWGDMDYGGIRIFQYMKQHIFPRIKPFCMDVSTYQRALDEGAGIPLEADKSEKLKSMDAGELETLKNAILETGMEIEQEWVESYL